MATRPWNKRDDVDPFEQYENWHRWMLRRMKDRDDKFEFKKCTILMKAQLYAACADCFDAGCKAKTKGKQ